MATRLKIMENELETCASYLHEAIFDPAVQNLPAPVYTLITDAQSCLDRALTLLHNAKAAVAEKKKKARKK